MFSVDFWENQSVPNYWGRVFWYCQGCTATLPSVLSNKQRIQSSKANLEVKATMRIPTIEVVLSHSSPECF